MYHRRLLLLWELSNCNFLQEIATQTTNLCLLSLLIIDIISNNNIDILAFIIFLRGDVA